MFPALPCTRDTALYGNGFSSVSGKAAVQGFAAPCWSRPSPQMVHDAVIAAAGVDIGSRGWGDLGRDRSGKLHGPRSKGGGIRKIPGFAWGL